MSELYRASVEALAYAVEALAEASATLRKIPTDDMRLADMQLIDRIARRAENAAATMELDRRAIARVEQ